MILAFGRKRSLPRIIAWSPTFRPRRTINRSPTASPNCTGRTSAVPSKLKETLSFENLNCAKGRKKPAPATQPKSSMVPEEDEKPVARGETAQEKAAAKQAEAMETQSKAAKVKEAKEEAEKKKKI